MIYKVVMVNGSPRGDMSTTKAILDSVMTGLKQQIQVDAHYIDSVNFRVDYCKGCLNCFEAGICPLDLHDDMLDIKKRLMDADVLIIGTPIYAGNVTAWLKLLFDRLSYWMHLMCLCGKPTVFVTSSTGNGVNFVKTYLSSLMKFMGGREISFKNYVLYSKDDLCDMDNVNRTNEVISDILKHLSNPISIGEKERVELDYVFNAMKNNIKFYEAYPNFEYNFWKKHGFFEYDSYMDIIKEADCLIPSFKNVLCAKTQRT